MHLMGSDNIVWKKRVVTPADLIALYAFNIIYFNTFIYIYFLVTVLNDKHY